MANLDRPFSETEKVNLLAEIIKTSPVPHTALLNIIYDFRIEPQWLEVSRPPGRSPQECRLAFDQVRANHPPPSGPPSARPSTATFQSPSQFIHRPFGPFEAIAAAAGSRNIQPRPEGVPHAAYPVASSPYTLQPQDQAFKKRGRPSNAEMELRKQEAEKRGEVYVPSRSRKRPKATGDAAATSPKGAGAAAATTTITTTTGQPAESASGTSSQRESYPAYSEPSPSSTGPPHRSPGAIDAPMVDPSAPAPPYGQERRYGQPSHLPPPVPQTPHHTPIHQQQPQQQHRPQPLPPPEQHIAHQSRLPSPSPYQRPPSMPLQGPTLPRLMQSSHPGPAQHSRPPSQSLQRPPEPIRRLTPPDASAGEPMEQ